MSEQGQALYHAHTSSKDLITASKAGAHVII